MRQVRGAYVDGAWGQVHVRIVGDASAGGPVAVFFHESPLSSAVYEGVLERLDPALTGIALDSPGYGASSPAPDPAAEIPDYAGVLLAAVRALGVGRFVAVGGHTGAALAIEVARQAEVSVVPGAVLSGVPIFTEVERQQMLQSWAPTVQPDADGSQFRWAVERYHRVWGAATPPRLLHLAVVELMRALPHYPWAYNACFRYDPWPALLAYGGALFLLNAEGDMFARSDADVAGARPAVQRRVMEGVPGQAHLRVPELYAREVERFVGEALGCF